MPRSRSLTPRTKPNPKASQLRIFGMIEAFEELEIQGSSRQPGFWSAVRRRRSTSRSKRSHRYASFPTTPTSRLTFSSVVVFRRLSATSRRSAKLSWGERSGMVIEYLVVAGVGCKSRPLSPLQNGFSNCARWVKNWNQFFPMRSFLLKRM